MLRYMHFITTKKKECAIIDVFISLLVNIYMFPQCSAVLQITTPNVFIQMPLTLEDFVSLLLKHCPGALRSVTCRLDTSTRVLVLFFYGNNQGKYRIFLSGLLRNFCL